MLCIVASKPFFHNGREKKDELSDRQDILPYEAVHRRLRTNSLYQIN